MMAPLTRITGLLWALSLSIAPAHCQSVEEADDITMLTGTRTDATKSSTGLPTGAYQTPSSRITLATTSLPTDLGPLTANYTDAAQTNTVTYLTGSITTSSSTITANGTSTSTSTTISSPQPTNTRPCNNYPELCARKYSNITQIGAHNSPFVRAGSAAANQQYPVKSQLDDGVRFLQAQIQWPTNATASTPPHFCHTSCDLLDAGPITDWLGQVKEWVSAHPYDVVTILLGNGNYSTPDKYAPFIEASGITQFVYTPAVSPMGVDDWPTLGQLILSGQRVVMFLDYMANQTAYPWLMDEFSQMWETPFDPVDASFPCTVQRPPGLGGEDAKKRLYMMNHNLNVEVSLLGSAIMVPAVSQLNVTNAVEGQGSLGMAANNCRTDWGRAPNVLNVDYYNYGNYPGSVFEVAARMNNVSYERRPCCGLGSSAGVRVEVVRSFVWMALAWMMWMVV